jgi:hypothetical protein
VLVASQDVSVSPFADVRHEAWILAQRTQASKASHCLLPEAPRNAFP